MKRLILIAVLLFSAVTFSYAQESAAKRAFTAGDYSAAVELYQAAIATAGTNSALSSGLDTAQKCASLKKKADAAYSSGSYKTAQQNYQAILKLNPSDSYVRCRISKCTQLQAAAEAKAAEAKKFQSELEAALSVGTPEALKAFVAKNPEDERSQLFLDYCRILENKNRLLTQTDVVVCRSMGKLQKCPASDAALDMAISYCDLESMYVKATAVLSDTKSKVDSRVKMMDLLAMASYGGYEPAKTALKEYNKKKNFGTARFHSLEYFTALRDCESNENQAAFVLANLKNYPVADKTALRLRAYMTLSFEKANLSCISESNLLAAQAVLDSKDPLKEKLLRAAARKGNLDADLELSNLPSCSLSEKEMLKKIYNGDQALGLTEQGFSEYVKYLKNDILEIEPIQFRSWLQRRKPYLNRKPFGFDTETLFRHDYLYAAILAFKKYPDQSNYNQVVLILDSYKNDAWDKDMVNEYLVLVSGTDKYSDKLKKKLKALRISSASGYYRRYFNDMYSYANLGYFDNMHKSSSVTSSQNQSRTYESYSYSDTYKVGDVIADALVFSVANNGKKGKMVRKKVFSADSFVCMTNQFQEINEHSESKYGYVKWRVATVDEYYTLFKQGYIKIEQQQERKRVFEVFSFCSLPVLRSGFIAYNGKHDNLFADDNKMYINSSFHGFGPGKGFYSYLIVAEFR